MRAEEQGLEDGEIDRRKLRCLRLIQLFLDSVDRSIRSFAARAIGRLIRHRLFLQRHIIDHVVIFHQSHNRYYRSCGRI